jgi:hypothetical protein
MKSLLEHEHFSAKMVFNDRGAIFIPVKDEHRSAKSDGISYKDNYEGNALAAMLSPGKLDIRYHADFTDSRVREIIGKLVSDPDLSFMGSWAVFYQGRQL